MEQQKHEPHIYLQAALSIHGGNLIQMSGRVFERYGASSYLLNTAREDALKVLEAIDAYEAAEKEAEAEVTIITPPTTANIHPAADGVQ